MFLQGILLRLYMNEVGRTYGKRKAEAEIPSQIWLFIPNMKDDISGHVTESQWKEEFYVLMS